MFTKKTVKTTIETAKILKIDGLKMKIFIQKEKRLRMKTTSDKEIVTDLIICKATNPEFIDQYGEYFAICSRSFLHNSAKVILGRIIAALSATMSPEGILAYIDDETLDISAIKGAIVDFADLVIKKGDQLVTISTLSDATNDDGLLVSIVGKRAAKKAIIKQFENSGVFKMAKTKNPSKVKKGKKTAEEKAAEKEAVKAEKEAAKAEKKAAKEAEKSEEIPDLDAAADTIA